MFTLKQFKKLSRGNQADVVRLNSTFIGDRQGNFCHKFLYFYNNFFIEVSYDQKNSGIGMMAFAYNYERIEQYLHAIDLMPVS